MKISHAWLQQYFRDTLPTAEKLAELFTFHSFEIEDIEDVNNGAHCEKVIDAKILPDRAHFCLSYRGIAEEVKVLTGMEYTDTVKSDYHGGHCKMDIDAGVTPVTVSIEASSFCRRYVARKVTGVEVKASSEKFKTFLESVGSRSISTIVDATNIAMFDYGQPLHVFDADKTIGVIVVRAAMDGEMITLLDDREVLLTSNDFVIADDEGPLAIAGVKGGKRAEVDATTKNIIIESANFEPTAVRKTSTKYNLRNESSKRFENEITPEWAMDGMCRVSALIHTFSPNAVFGPITDIYPYPVAMTIVVTTVEFINKKLGIVIPTEKIKEILKSFSIGIEEKENELVLTIPYHRFDLRIPEDIVEEVGRIYGYEKIEGTKQSVISSSISTHPSFYITEHIKNILVDLGFSESYLYTFVAKGDSEVAYPLASDKKALRTTLSDGIEKALDTNARNADFLFLDSIKMFEIGKVFTKKGEHTSLCIGIRRVKKVKGQSANEDIKQTRETLLQTLGVDVATACTIDDTGGSMLLKGKQIGIINTIEGVLELDLDALISAITTVGIPLYESIGFGPSPKFFYKSFSTYPFIVRDIAIFVPDSVKSDEIESIITSNGTALLLKHKLFDTFQKDGKTSYAFRMIFQSFERTLTDDEINTTMAVIADKMKGKSWEVR